ncbi:MAG: LPXTG cell wall anchor domain-containing protein, partial [Actinobacteria bacterium]|nr:LPXTG cell wall anchor domain-containing protein [Actinomycetota bacterium]
YLITGLTNNTTYAIRIRAHNAVGSSHASHSVSATPFSPVIPATGTNTPGAIAIALMTLLAGAGAVLVAARNRTHIRR